jgi:3-keto-disaccharide hydrolase
MGILQMRLSITRQHEYISSELTMMTMKRTLTFLVGVMMIGCVAHRGAKSKWISLFNGKDLTGWTPHGKTTWSVQHGVLVGIGGMGHIYTDVTCTNFEFKGKFRISKMGATANSGFYFRAHPPADNVDGFPRGYEAQICNDPKEAYTGWLWKPGKPTGKATKLLTKDGEWFSYRIRVVGTHIQFWINGKPVMTYDDSEYKSGHFAIQAHNPGMKIEAKDLYYRVLSK